MMLYDGHTYLNRLRYALSCGRPGCPCAEGDLLHCPAHHDAHIPNLAVDGPPDNPVFTCQRGCSDEKIIAALSLRSLMPPERILTATDAIEVGLQPLSSLTPHPFDWLWPGLIPLRALTLIAGCPGSGKTAIALDIAARASGGALAPGGDGVPIAQVPVLLVSLAHPSPAPFIHYLEALDADISHIYLADIFKPRVYHGDDDYAEYLNAENDDDPIPHPALRQLWHTTPPPIPAPVHTPPPREPALHEITDRIACQAAEADAGLIIVDQLEHLALARGAGPRRVLANLNVLAQRTGAAVLALCNIPTDALPRARRAAAAYAPIPRSILATARLPEEDLRILLPVSPAAPPIPYRIAEHSLQWSAPIPRSQLPGLDEPSHHRPPLLDSACRLLDSMLAEGPQPAAEIKRAAGHLGVSRHYLRKARRLRNVRSIRAPGPRTRWQWCLPSPPPPAPPTTRQNEFIETPCPLASLLPSTAP